MAQKQRRINKKSFWHRIRFKYKLSFFNEGTLEEVWSFRLSQLSAFAMLALFAFLLIAFTAFIIIKTPIRNYLPGYLDVEVRKEDRKSTRLNSSHASKSRMPSSA